MHHRRRNHHGCRKFELRSVEASNAPGHMDAFVLVHAKPACLYHEGVREGLSAKVMWNRESWGWGLWLNVMHNAAGAGG